MSEIWLDVTEAAAHAKCGKRSIYSAVSRRRLRAARLGGRRELRFLPRWIDEWLLATCTPVDVCSLPPDDAIGGDGLKSGIR